MSSTNKRWYVVFIGDQKRVSSLPSAIRSLTSDSAVWEPKKTIVQKIRGKNREVHRPLFPGYVFVNIDLNVGDVEDSIKAACGGSVLKMPGDQEPKALTDVEVSHIHKLAEENKRPQSIEDRYALDLDQAVEITNGPFQGTKGIIKEIKRESVIVEVSIFGRNVLAEVPPVSCFAIND